MQRIGETENVVGSIVTLHRVPALAERKRAAEFADDLMAIPHHSLGGQCECGDPAGPYDPATALGVALPTSPAREGDAGGTCCYVVPLEGCY